MSDNLLSNPHILDEAVEFKHRVYYWTTQDPYQDYYITNHRHQLTRPEHWGIWVEHAEEVGLVVPEVKLGEYVYRDHRWLALGDDDWARPIQAFAAYQTTRCGVFQVVGAKSGHQYSLTAHAHGWSSNGGPVRDGQKLHDPLWSDGVGFEAFAMAYDDITANYSGHEADVLQSLVFRIGIDPTGGIDPFGSDVVWGSRWCIYNTYHALPTLEVEAVADNITVFGWMENRWQNAHNDRYMTNFVLMGDDAVPMEPYDRYVIVADPNLIGSDGAADVYRDAGARMLTVTPSHQDANPVPLPSEARTNTVEIPGVTQDNVADYRDYHRRRNPETRLVFPDLDTPSPTPPPSPPMATHSKIGAHCIDEHAMSRLCAQIAQYGPCPTIKAYGTDEKMAWLANIKRVSPETVTVGRLSTGVDPDVNVEGPGFDDPDASAQRVFDSLLPIWQKHPYVDYWEVINEQDEPGPDGHVRIAQFFVRMMALCRPHGIKLALFSYSMGVPDPNEWDAIYNQTQCLQMAAQEGHVLALHEYGWMDDNYDYLVGRFDWLFRRYPDLIGAGLRVVITEYNITESEAGAGMSDVTLDVWLDQLRRYDDLLRSRTYVIGAHLFTFGGGGGWTTYDVYQRGWDDDWADYVISRFDDGGTGLSVATYSQRDPQWAGLRLGESRHTMGRAGCAVTAVTMLASQVSNWTPGQMVRWLNDHDGFTSGGLLYWAKVAEAIEGLEFVTYYRWRDPGQVADMEVVRRVLGRGPAVVQVDFNPADSDLDSHFVLALGFTSDGQDMDVLDPWTGTRRRLLDVYGINRSLEEAVFAMAEYRLSASPPSVPPGSGAVRGVHAPISTATPANVDALVNRLTALGVRWYKMLYNGDPGTLELMDELMQAGIQPVVRIYDDAQLPGRNQVIELASQQIRAHIIDEVAAFNAAYGTQFVPYIEVMNEPNLAVEWQMAYQGRVDWHDDDLVNQVAGSWWIDARDVIAMGGRPALPAMAPTDRNGTNQRYSGWMWFQRILDALMRNHDQSLTRWIRDGRVWLAAHSAAFARPFGYDPRRPWGVDDMCLRGYEVVQDYVHDVAGFQPVTILTEGGVYSPFHMWELGWAAPDLVVRYEGSDEEFYRDATWGDRVREAFAYLEDQGRVLGCCMWHLADAGSSSEWLGGGWYGPDWEPRSPVVALAGAPALVV